MVVTPLSRARRRCVPGRSSRCVPGRRSRCVPGRRDCCSPTSCEGSVGRSRPRVCSAWGWFWLQTRHHGWYPSAPERAAMRLRVRGRCSEVSICWPEPPPSASEWRAIAGQTTTKRSLALHLVAIAGSQVHALATRWRELPPATTCKNPGTATTWGQSGSCQLLALRISPSASSPWSARSSWAVSCQSKASAGPCRRTASTAPRACRSVPS